MYLDLTSRKILYSPFSRLRKKTGLTVREVSGKVGFSTRTVYRWEKGETSPPPPVIEYLKRIAEKSARFSFIDLFAGIGGLRRGFESIGGNCVFTSEWDRHCRKVYADNYRCDHEIAGDIREVKSSDIPKHDLLLAGFPCQPFSIAGVSKRNALKIPHGFRCDTQGTLFFEVARIIEHHRPKAFLLENVKNLAGHDRGKTFNVILQALTEELGYHVSWRIINARSYVPQHRERIFIAGFREGNGSFSLDNLKVPDPDNGPRLESILHPEDGSESPTVGFIHGSRGKVLPKYTLTDHLWNYLQAYAEKHRRKGNGFGFGLVGPGDVARTLSARYFKDGSEILIRQRGKNPRRLTPRECARIMGFDKSGNGGGFRITVSDTQAYKQFGNAVVVPVVKAVARHMRPAIVNGAVQKTGNRSVVRHR